MKENYHLVLESGICMNMEMRTWGTGLCDYTLVVDDNKFRQSCLQSKQRVFLSPRTSWAEAHLKVSWAVDGGPPGGGGGLRNLNIRTHSLAFISCNTHLRVFSSAPGIHQLSRSPRPNAAETPFLRISRLTLRGGQLLSSHLCVSLVCMTRAGGDAGVSLKEG